MYKKREDPAVAEKKQLKLSELWGALVGDRERANERLIGIITGIAFGFAAYFLGQCELLFSTFPLGIALLCAADRHLPYILAGLCLSSPSLEISPAVTVVTYIVIAFIRIFTKLLLSSDKSSKKSDLKAKYTASEWVDSLRKAYLTLFSESVYLRMASACIGAFCLSLYAIILGGFRYYDLFGAFFAIVTAPVATFVFSAHFEKSLKGTRLYELGTLALLAAVTYSVRYVSFFGIYVGAFLAFFSTLCIGRRKGILGGCVAGLFLGLAFRPIYAPLFVLEAAAAGVLWNISALAAATAGCVVGTIWGVYVNGFSSLSELLPAFLCGAMVFGAADRLSLITDKPELIRIRDEDRASLEALVKEQINTSDEACMKRLSNMFSELAGAFYNLSDRLRRPAALDLKQMCDGVFDKHCIECPRRELCWGVEYSSTLDVLNRITADLHMKARADVSAVPEYLRERCYVMPNIISEINENCARLTEHALLCDRTGIFALDYDGVSRLLSEALESGRADYIIDESSAATVAELLKKLRFSYTGVIAYGGRRKTLAVKGLDASRAKVGTKNLREHLEKAMGMPLAEPIFTPVGSCFDMMVSSRRRFSAKSTTFSLNSLVGNGGGNYCGDTVSSFETDSDYYYSLLSDGMGAGKEAAFTSRISSMFLEKMLSANNRSETSIKLLNSFMSERDGGARHECSATVDLFEFDLISGRAAVLKSGAAPTFIKRGSNCFKLQSKTLPLGIIDTPDIERISFDVEPDDLIIMVSDGVTQSNDCPWLVSMLNTETFRSSEEIARKIAEKAREIGSEDDITVTVIEISKYQ